MQKILNPSFLFILLFVCYQYDAAAQCNRQDTSIQHHVGIANACGLAYSQGKIAVTSYDSSSYGAPATVQVWNDRYKFTDLFPADYTITLTAPEAAAFDAAGNLYVVQTERPDSNIMIYDPTLSLIEVINNAADSTHWVNPRGIAFDSAQNLYIISQDSTGPAPLYTDIPNTGKLIKITDPLGAATRSVLLTGLNNPKAVAIKSGNLYISEYGANKVSRYNLYTMSVIDTAHINEPMDLFTTGCILYCTEQATQSVKVLNAVNLTDAPAATITGFSTQNSPFGVALDDAYNLFVSDNGNNRVVFYKVLTTDESYYSGRTYYCVQSYPALKDSIPPTGIYHQWQSLDTSIASVDTAGNILGLLPGTCSVIQITGTDTITYNINTTACDYVLCLGSSGHIPSYFPPDTPIVNNIWISSNAAIVTVSDSGSIYGANVGSVTISHIINNDTMTFPVSVWPTTGSPAGPIYTLTDTSVVYGAFTFCVSSVIQLLETSTNGSWAGCAIADVEDDGSVWPSDTGTGIVTYTISNGCYSNTQSFEIIVQGPPSVSPISNNDTVCRGSTITLTDSTVGGIWSSIDSTKASIDPLTGIVSGLQYGSTTISYTVGSGNTCGAVAAVQTVVVDTPNAGVITGASTICNNDSITLSASIAGGTWTCSNTSDNISATGVFSANDTGVVTISYSVVCTALPVTFSVTVNPTANAGLITGADTVCVGSTITLTDIAAGGTWSCVNSNATVAGGIVTGVTAGSDTIRYIATSSCGNDTAIFTITIQGAPPAGTISGASSLCINSSATLSETQTGGTWTVSNGLASVSDGTVSSGPSAGSDIIYYITGNGCGYDTASYTVNISGYPDSGIIYGVYEMCVSSSTTFYDYGDPGTWSIADETIANIDTYGDVNPITSGTTNVIYTVENVCGTYSTTFSLTIDPVPNPGTITGPSEFCISDNPGFVEYGDGLGAWSIDDPSIASIDPVAGVIYPYSGGTTNVVYIESNTCGADSATQSITIDTVLTTETILGSAAALCPGMSDTIYIATQGGSWSSSNADAGITAFSSGAYDYLTATGTISGTDTLMYTATNTCNTALSSQVITVNPLPYAGIISAPPSICVDAGAALSVTGSGGTWSCLNGHAAVVSGVVAGISAGTDVIVYKVINSCGIDSATYSITVNPLPDAGTITGAASVCAGGSVTLTDVATDGSWSSGNGNATVTAGIVDGITAGTDTIMYSVNNTCGSDTAIHSIIINLLPVAGTITGAGSVCQGSAIALTDPAIGGTWISSNTDAGVSGGTVTGLAAGSDTIIYRVTNSCGTDSATHIVTINPLPLASTIIGAGSVCSGDSITLTDATTGGTWSSSNGNATVTSGTVTGVTAGTDTLLYTVSNTCGSDTAVHSITINPIPVAGTITGADSVCQGSEITLIDPAIGGTWISSNTDAGVAGGTVNGLAGGTDTIIYRISNTCGTDSATHIITVNPLPVAGTITGAASVCAGDSVTLADIATGGIWSSSNGNALVNTGTVTGIITGIDTIMYAVTNICGTQTAIHTITINSIPDPGTITGIDVICQGTSTPLTDGATGGTWISSNADATITGGLLAGTTAGTDTIIYRVSNVCGSDSTLFPVTINPLPDAGVISGATSLCAGDSVILFDVAPGGSWHVSSGSATVSGGIVTGVSSGSVAVVYSVTNSCGEASAIHTMTVNPQPDGGTITGADSVCQGFSAILTETSFAGSWVSADTNATVSGGVVTGLASGTDTILYITTNVCGIDTAAHIISILATPVAGSIAGADSICAGTPYMLTDSVAGGTWTSSNTHATVTTTGIITGITSGTVTVTYQVSNVCGSATASHAVTIGSLVTAGTISGSDTVCQGSSLILTDGTASAGGSWSSSDNSIATISGSGVVYGIYMGIDTIHYSVTSICGTSVASFTIYALSDSICSQVSKVNTVSIDNAQLKVYPNPNNGMFTIDLLSDLTEDVTINVTDMLGRKVLELKTVTNQPADIKLSAAVGVYFVNVSTVQGTYTAKVIVSN